MKILITGGCGFIGSAVVRLLVKQGHSIINLDAMTYAATETSVAEVAKSDLYAFEKVDIRHLQQVTDVFSRHDPDAVMHLAAESHVDRSIEDPASFVQTNINGTFNLLEAARQHWDGLPTERKENFRFHHVSTDEVFGTLGDTGLFTEDTPYAPNSPYSASKAGSDHLVRAWFHTYGLPVLISNCSNNYGPYQFPEKLIPLMILNGLDNKPLPIYGRGENVRDWLFVEDHADALVTILTKGVPGESYNVSGKNERRNIDVVNILCALLDELKPLEKGSYKELITHVMDRPGHDKRYAIDASKIQNELNWAPKETFETGLRKTVEWYLEREDWWQPIRSSKYDGTRLGLSKV